MGRDRQAIPNVPLFSPFFRTLWALLLCITVACEVLPLRPVAAALLYSYVGWKVLLFASLGFVMPLAFWRFDNIGRGILLSAVTAGLVEFLQAFSPGHRSSYLEFGGKLVLLLIGFVLGLNTRYNGLLRIGPFQRTLVNTHQTFKD